MRFVLLGAVALSAQVACTLGAPAMNDAEETESIVEQLSVARKESLPECTVARDGIRGYVRDARFVATCFEQAWRDPQGNIVETAAADGGKPVDETPSTELPSSDAGPGTVAQP